MRRGRKAREDVAGRQAFGRARVAEMANDHDPPVLGRGAAASLAVRVGIEKCPAPDELAAMTTVRAVARVTV
jgi:hypothetical protein